MTDYVIANPKSTGCQTCLSGGMTLEKWEIEDEKFYNNEGKTIMTRNLWASIPNLLLGFAVWLMWSVVVKRVQIAHDLDPSAYYFKDFAGEHQGVSDGYRTRRPLYRSPRTKRPRASHAAIQKGSCVPTVSVCLCVCARDGDRWLPGVVQHRVLQHVAQRRPGRLRRLDGHPDL